MVSFQDRVQQCFVEQIAGLSCGCAGAVHHQGGCHPCEHCISSMPGIEHEKFASVLWASDVGLVATFSDEIEAMRTCMVDV